VIGILLSIRDIGQDWMSSDMKFGSGMYLSEDFVYVYCCSRMCSVVRVIYTIGIVAREINV